MLRIPGLDAGCLSRIKGCDSIWQVKLFGWSETSKQTHSWFFMCSFTNHETSCDHTKNEGDFIWNLAAMQCSEESFCNIIARQMRLMLSMLMLMECLFCEDCVWIQEGRSQSDTGLNTSGWHGAIIIIAPSPQQQPPFTRQTVTPDKFSCYDWVSFCQDFLEDG